MTKEELAKMRESWIKWNEKCHPEDTITWMDWLGEMGVNLDEEF